MTDLTLFDGDRVSPFDSIRLHDDEGREFWSARDLMPLLGYDRWENFLAAIKRAQHTAANQGHAVDDLFRALTKNSGGRPRVEVHLSRYAAYLIAMNGDPRKPEVAAAQSYFAIRTREAETTTPAAPAELTRMEILQLALAAEEENQHLRGALEVARPKVEAFESFVSSVGDYSVNEAAKTVSRHLGFIVGERRLRSKLEEWGWIYRQCGAPRARQSQVDNGRLHEKARYHSCPVTGERVVDTPQVRVTAKGLDAIRTRLARENAA
jgi:DNA-damage-inducible protein D